MDAGAPVEMLAVILARHTTGDGVLGDLFSNLAALDVHVSAPANENPIRVVVDGVSMSTNVRLAPGGVGLFTSRLRCVSGVSFSRADPTLGTVVEAGDMNVWVMGMATPASDGLGLTFRRHDEVPLMLPTLVANGALSADAAVLYSFAVERGASVPVAGSRGAGKTTLLGSLLWGLPRGVRTALIEGTSELPALSLLDVDHDVQSPRADTTGDPESTP